MCPACMTLAALTIASATSTSGLTVLAFRKIAGKLGSRVGGKREDWSEKPNQKEETWDR
jgi:hypothetical protein